MKRIQQTKANVQASYRLQRGLSLIELMVAITLGLLVLAATAKIFVDTSRSNQEMAKTNSQIENARFAMQLLENDIVHGGFWGGYVPVFDDLTQLNAVATAERPTAVPDPCLAYASWTPAYITSLLGIPVQTYRAGDAPPSGTGCVTNFATDRQTNTDVLVVRHAETCAPGDVNCGADTSGKLYFQPSLCGPEIAATPYVLSDSGFTLHNRTCDNDGNAATLPALPITDVGAADDAVKRRFISNVYFVRDYATIAGDGIPTLMRSTFDCIPVSGGACVSTNNKHQAAEPLIEGIEAFRVELGIDHISDAGTAVNYTLIPGWTPPPPANQVSPTNRGDGSPDTFVNCTAPCLASVVSPATVGAAVESGVVAVKLYVLSRADRVTPGYTDSKTYTLGSATVNPCAGKTGAALATCRSYKRHVFSTTVRLHNVSGRRETP